MVQGDGWAPPKARPKPAQSWPCPWALTDSPPTDQGLPCVLGVSVLLRELRQGSAVPVLGRRGEGWVHLGRERLAKERGLRRVLQH